MICGVFRDMSRTIIVRLSGGKLELARHNALCDKRPDNICEESDG
ncbi:hypothetical protein [Devosia sp. DBB001]|nr:hypothetical protein [Devosia sp. DBB001]